MNRLILAAGLSIALLSGSVPSLGKPTNSTCERSCMDSALSKFLAAVIAKDPPGAPLAIGFRETENAVLTPAGVGPWQSVTALGPVTRRYFDPVTGNALLFGIVTDRGQPAVASLRVKIENRKITEGEWHIAHQGDPGISGQGSKVLFDVAKLAANPPPERVVPQGQRLPRETLVAIVNSYFDGLAAGNGRAVLAHGGCSRFENGFEVSGRPITSGDPSDGYNGRGDCTSGYRSLAVALVAARRYLLVDEDAQVVVASAVFVRKPGDPRRRNHFMEVFGIDGGKIRTVHAAMFYADPDLPLPNWPPYEGNFPLVTNSQPTK
jgi:hypothetical protein